MGQSATLGANGWEVVSDGAQLVIAQESAVDGEIKSNAGGIKFPIPRRNDPVRYATFGDSTADSGYANTDISIVDLPFPASGQNTVVTVDSQVTLLSAAYPQAYLVANGGISGQNTTQMLARDTLAASVSRKAIQDVINLYPDVVFLRAGSINDLLTVTSATIDAVVESSFNNHTAIIKRFLSGGVLVVDDGLFGYSAAGATSPDQTRVAIRRLNALFATFAEQTPGVTFVNAASVLSDANGAFLTGMARDGIHLSVKGQYALVALEKQAMDELFGYSAGPRYKGTNIALNPMLSSTSVQAYGTLATNISVGATNVTRQNAKVESINGKNFQTVEFIPTASGASGSILHQFDLTTMSISVGDTLGFEFDFYMSGLNGGPTPSPTAFFGRLDLQKSGAGRILLDRLTTLSTIILPDGSYMGKCAFQPVKFQEASAALLAVGPQMNLALQNNDMLPYKLGFGGHRIVKLP